MRQDLGALRSCPAKGKGKKNWSPIGMHTRHRWVVPRVFLVVPIGNLVLTSQGSPLLGRTGAGGSLCLCPGCKCWALLRRL